MGIEKHAFLIRAKESLELKICDSDKQGNQIIQADINQELRESLGFKSDEGVIGEIIFRDERSSYNILNDFLKIYACSGMICTPNDLPPFLNYPFRYEPILSHAFVNYFSNLNKESSA